ncbi:MAG: hypothetical protein VYC34_10915 [Planctomycetota bacterium]|nr:hypothetical protein [Planctomycetota bacterium]
MTGQTRANPATPRPAIRGALLVGAALILLTGAAAVLASERENASPECMCELKSWVVMGRGRHMYLRIACPAPNESLSGVVEYTSSAQREDFAGLRAGPFETPRVARMTPGRRLRPLVQSDPDRLEGRWRIDLDAARCLQRDRVYEREYNLLGVNSNSGLRAACESCGIELPDLVLNGGGLTGDFPGIDLDAGNELPASEWPRFGLDAPPEDSPG